MYMDKRILEFIGSDAGFGDNNNSAYIENEECFTLIDCGFTVFNMIKGRFNYSKYKEINVIITHLHNDHAGSLSQFIMLLWYKYNKKVNVYSKCMRIKDYLDVTGTPIDSYNLYSNGDNIEFISTNHVKELDSYGFKLKCGNSSIIYTGDTTTLEPYLNYMDGVSEMYVDVSKDSEVHLKIYEEMDNLRFIKDKGVNVYLMHTDDNNYISEVVSDEFYLV